MANHTGLSPNNPLDYKGPNVYLSVVVTRPREPTGADYRQPETGKLYVFGTIWLVGKDPTTGVQGDFWYLSKIAANVAYWVKLASAIAGPVFSIGVDASTLPGTDPVLPIAGVINATGGQVASGVVGLNVIRTNSLAAGEFTIEIQRSGSSAVSDTTLNGVSHFNNTQFSVVDGFVSLVGGGGAIDSVGVQTGTNPVVADGAGLITINGAVVPAGVNPVRSDGTGPNTLAIEVQISQAIAATNALNIGLSAFDSAAFDVDANGFVQLNGGGIATTSFGVQANTVPGTNPVLPTAAGLVTINGAAVANHSVVLETRSRAANTYNLEIQYATTSAVTDATKSGVAHFDSTDFAVDANGFVSLAGAGAGQTITGDTGGALPPTAGNWNIVGGSPLSAGTNASVTSGTGSTLTVTSINCAKWIVDATANRGTHTTIAGAIAAATSGETIFIRPGTYTENLTLKAGVNLAAFECDSSLNGTGHVIISGNATLSTAGSVTITGIQLQTNSAAFLTVSGSVASVVNLNNCYLNCTNATGISYSSSSATSGINIFNCTGNLGTTGIALYTMSSTGSINFSNCFFRNSGVSVTASSNSAGSVFFNYSVGPIAFSTSGTGSFIATQSILNLGVLSNTTCVTTAGTSITNGLTLSTVTSGSASAVSIGSGTTMNIHNTVVISSNTNAITGAGTVLINGIATSLSSTINTTTQTLGVFNGAEYKGRTINTVPSAGMLGERITNSATGGGLTTGTPANVTSIALTPGIWDVSSIAYITNNGTSTTWQSGISTTSATFAGNAGVDYALVVAALGSGAFTLVNPVVRATLSANTTYYLVAQSTFTTGISSVNGRITAVRVA